MQPQKNYTPKPLTRTRLEELALRYVGRYAASRAMLEGTLMNHFRRARRVQKDLIEAEVKKWIAEITAAAVRKGWLNDESYAQMIINQGKKSGWSKYKINQKLVAKGIAPALIKDLLQDDAESEFQAALVYARRKALGPFRKKKDTDPRKEMERA
ncbi:MAG: RecX family transcriptional regulator [Proteobacteria bacterium]|nr:RecX family transcriptional regulator [Pseudomonadota bacterium]